jgi:hypothetical protein
MDRGCCKVKRGAGRKEVKRSRGWEWLIERFEAERRGFSVMDTDADVLEATTYRLTMTSLEAE